MHWVLVKWTSSTTEGCILWFAWGWHCTSLKKNLLLIIFLLLHTQKDCKNWSWPLDKYESDSNYPIHETSCPQMNLHSVLFYKKCLKIRNRSQILSNFRKKRKCLKKIFRNDQTMPDYWKNNTISYKTILIIS